MPWRLVAALGLTQITAWGSIYYLFALLLPHLQRDLDGSPAAVVGAFSVALLTSGMLAPGVGRWIDRFGGRALMTAGSVLGAVGLLLLARVQALSGLYAVWILLGVAMAATLYEPAFAVIARASAHGYRRAIGVVTLFGGLASTVFWPLGQWLIERYGWRDATALLGLLNLALCVPLHAGVLPGAAPRSTAPAASAAVTPAHTGQDLRSALRDARFYLLGLAFTANALVLSAMAVHLMPMLVEKGLTPLQAAAVGAMVGPMQVLGRFVELTWAYRFKPLAVGVVAMALLPASLLLFHALGPWPVLFGFFALLYGAGNGIGTIVRGTIPAEIFGRAHYGAVAGAVAAPVLVAKASGPLVAALLWAASGSYAALALTLAAVAAVSVLGLATLWRYPAQHTAPVT